MSSYAEFKRRAREHQVQFREQELGVGYHLYPNVLTYEDASRGLIFYEGFRSEILAELQRPIPKTSTAPSGQMLTNLLRSEHIPYNIFFQMRKDMSGCARMLDEIVGDVSMVSGIAIEHHPEPIEEYLADHTAFDVYIEYRDAQNRPCAIGVEVKYTEKEYPLKEGSSEQRHIQDENGQTRLFENYLNATVGSGYYRDKVAHSTLVTNKFRQIWRNHILGASMVLHGDIYRFTSIHLYPMANVHFCEDAIPRYCELLTDKGRKSFVALTYERLFDLMDKHLDVEDKDGWIAYLKRRYIF